MLDRYRPQIVAQLGFVEAVLWAALAQRGPVLAQHPAREPFGRSEPLLRHANRTASGFGAQIYPFPTSLRMSLART